MVSLPSSPASFFLLVSLFFSSNAAISSFHSFEPECAPYDIAPELARITQLRNIVQWCVRGSDWLDRHNDETREIVRWQRPIIQCECTDRIQNALGEWVVVDKPELVCWRRNDIFNTMRRSPYTASEITGMQPQLFDGSLCKNWCFCDKSQMPKEDNEPLREVQKKGGLRGKVKGLLKLVGLRKKKSGTEENEGLFCNQKCSSYASCGAARNTKTCGDKLACVADPESGGAGTYFSQGFCLDLGSPGLKKRGLTVGLEDYCMCNSTYVGRECCESGSVERKDEMFGALEI